VTVTPHLFGKAGDVYPKILRDIVSEAAGVSYFFMDIEQYKALPLSQRNKIYWEEVLYRVHWAAVANSIRHLRWFDACVVHATLQPNYLAFCAALRGFLESAADTKYSLQPVSLTIADSAASIIEALNGKLNNSLFQSTELENALIHFHHARKVGREEAVPPAHKAETAAKYVAAIDHPNYPVRDLYSELCQVVHPAEPSLHWLTQVGEGGWKVGKQDDIGSIQTLVDRYKDSVSWIQQNSGNIIILMCQVLNSLPKKQLHVEAVRLWSMSELQLYKKIKNGFGRHGLRWPS
jgi:hypothetical protein|tara:strand:+ start:2318 stop:3193 length:876 start_codon:yes stop_codon:yes gene_type:complete